ncbi:MAG: ParB/RepB/Spo0J family partition protein [Desulfobacterales bacterium]
MSKAMPDNRATPRKRKKMALGKGLDALIPSTPENAAGAARDYFLCDIDVIHPNRYQPRRRFAEADLDELSDSIRVQGIIQPLLVRKQENGYELVAGERRLRAARRAGLTQVPVVLKDVDDAEMLEMSIVENIQREDFNPIEEADAYHRLITEFGLTQDEAAVRVGKSRSAVTNFLRLRQLSDPIKETIIEGQLSMGHARALLGVEDPIQRTHAWRTVLSKGLSVRETEQLIRRLKQQPKAKPKPEPSTLDRHLSAVADDLSRHFGTKVSIQRDGQGRKGKLQIEFYSSDDLNRLIGLLKPES